MKTFEKISDALTAAKDNIRHDAVTNHPVVLNVRRPARNSYAAFFASPPQSLVGDAREQANNSARLAYNEPQEIIDKIETKPYPQ